MSLRYFPERHCGYLIKNKIMKRNLCFKTVCMLVALVCCIPGYAWARKTMPRKVDKTSDFYHVVRAVPEGFRFVEDGRAITLGDSWSKDHQTGRIWKRDGVKTATLGTVLQSDDKQCEVMYERIFDTQFFVSSAPVETFRGFYYELDLKHRNYMMNVLTARLGRPDVRFEDYVTVISGREARQRFNADSIFVFEVPIEPLQWDGEVYTHCIHQVLTRKDRAYMGFVWLFTDEGYKRRQEYMDTLEGNVAYKKGRWKKPELIKRMEEW